MSIILHENETVTESDSGEKTGEGGSVNHTTPHETYTQEKRTEKKCGRII
jgi:hypothetical protein